MNDNIGGPTTGTTHAVLIDVAEIGAALGSGDRELGETIISARRPSNSVEQALLELLDGGALIDLWDGHYAEAFNLLCDELGECLPTSGMATTTAVDPFEIPTMTSSRIGIMSSEHAAAFLAAQDGTAHPEPEHLTDWCRRAEADNMSIAMFTHIGPVASEPGARDPQLVSSEV